MNKIPKVVDDTKLICSLQEFLDVKWLWKDDYYDGPLSGMIEIGGGKYYAWWSDVGFDKRWIYLVYKLSKERQDYEEYWRALFLASKPFADGWSYFNYIHKLNYNKMDFITNTNDGQLIGWFED